MTSMARVLVPNKEPKGYLRKPSYKKIAMPSLLLRMLSQSAKTLTTS
jgi:hypothetical protein